MWLLTMKRGKREIKIGMFFHRNRAESVAVGLGWSRDWKAVIKV